MWLKRSPLVLLFSTAAFGQTPTLNASDVSAAIQGAALATDGASVIAVTDRVGYVLGVYRQPGAPTTAIGNFGQTVDANELAVNLARTASFFSNSDAPLSSRTVRYISGIHFPPGIMFTGNAALYGIENTNRGCPLSDYAQPGDQFIPPARNLDNTAPGLGIITGKADVNDSDPNAVNPGGVPIFKGGLLVGGIGVVGDDPDVAEYAATVGSFGPNPSFDPNTVVFIDGIALPFVNNTTSVDNSDTGTFGDGTWVPIQTPGCASPGPCSSPGPTPERYLVNPRNGAQLSAGDVDTVIQAVVAQGNQTRALIRLPMGMRARFMIAVSDLDGTILGLFRMPDATIFSIDVAASKARNVVYFSGPTRQDSDLPGVPQATAVTNRTISFGGQPLYPPGIDGSGPGPFFNLYQFDTLNPCTQGQQPASGNQSGIVFFPGSAPLYRNGVLVGGLGVSGDGVDQDDFATSAGAAFFLPPDAIRADNVFDQGVRLPYQHFPRNPTQ